MSIFVLGKNEIADLKNKKENLDAKISSGDNSSSSNNIISFDNLRMKRERAKIQSRLDVLSLFSKPDGDNNIA